MASGFGNPPRSRQSLLSIIMLVVLLAGIAAAWIVAWPARISARNGREILIRIRQDGLEAIWGQSSIDLWFLASSGDSREKNPVGWGRITRRPAPGKYVGAHLLGGRRDITLSERWALSTDATAGRCEISRQGKTGSINSIVSFGKTEIIVAMPTVSTRPATSRTPQDFLPKGLRWLVLSLAAKQGRRVSCRTVLNGSAAVGEKVRFQPVQLAPQKDGRLRETFPGLSGGRIYSFDEQGLVEKIEELGSVITYQRVSPAEVLTHFPWLRLLLGPPLPGHTSMP